MKKKVIFTGLILMLSTIVFSEVQWNVLHTDYAKKMIVDELGDFYSINQIGVTKSTDEGETWNATSYNATPRDGHNTTGGAALLSNGDIFVGSLDNGVYLSTDHGGTWTNTFGTGYGTGSRRMIPVDNSALMSYGGFLRGIYKWNTSTQSWNQKFTLSADFYDFVQLPNGDIYATAQSANHIGGIYKSTDDGENWSLVLQTQYYDNPATIEFYNGVLYYLSNNEEFWKSEDLGVNWSLVSTLTQFNSITDLQITPDGTIFASFVADNGVLYSEDLGVTWNSLNTGLPSLNVMDFTYYDSKLYVATYGGLCVLEDSDEENYSLYFGQNGNNVYIPTLNDSQYRPITYEAWLKVEDLIPPLYDTHYFRGIMGRNQIYNTQIGALTLASETTYENIYNFWTGGGGILSDIQATSGEYLHIVFTWNNDYTATWYINGNLVKQDLFNYECGANLNFYIGYIADQYSWDGWIDEVKIWDHVRTQAEIQNNLNTPLTGNEPGLIAYWDFNEGNGNILYDKSPNGHNGTINGATWSTDVPEFGVTANFSAEPTSGYVPLIVNFTDESIPADSIVSWQWDFENDGIIDSNDQNPSFTYTSEGTFSVKLIIESITEADTLIKTDYITTQYGPPQNLTANPTLIEIELDWEQCFQPNILLYKIFRDTSPNPTTQINSTVHPDTNYVDTNVAMNTTYYYRVTGYTSLGEETDYSNEVSVQLLPQMSVDPTSFDFVVNAESNNAIIDSFLINNTGGGRLNYSIAGSDTLDDAGYCLEFDGVDDYTVIDYSPNLNISNVGSFSAWVKPGYTNYGVSPSKAFLSQHGGWSQRGWSLCAADGNLRNVRFHWQAGQDNFLDTSNEPLETGVWAHVVGVASETHIMIYINGELNIQMPNSESVNGDYDVEIGRCSVGANSNFYGIIDEVAIFNIALNETQIVSIYSGNSPISYAGLTGYWNFNEGSGTIAYDATTNENNGTIYGAQWIESTIQGGVGSILSFNPSSGILNAGSRLSQQIDMTIDVGDLADGIYNTSADISHNDPNVINPFVIPVIIAVDKTAPEKITNLNSTETMTAITLYWDENTATDLSTYNIYRSIDPNDPTLLDFVNSNTTTFVDNNLPNEEDSYYYWVSAVDDIGNEGSLSDSILTYLDIPATVENIALEIVGSDAILNWSSVNQTVYGNPIQNLTGYIVYFTEKIYNADTLFSYLAFTPDTTYSHDYAGIFADRMFYKVTAYVGELDILQDILAEKPNLILGELNGLIEKRKFIDNMKKVNKIK